MSDTIVRCASFQILSFAEDRKESRKREAVWRETHDVIGEMNNLMWDIWGVWHSKNKSRQKLRKFMEQYKAWAQENQARKEIKGEKPPRKHQKPPNPVKAIPSELSKLIYSTLANEYPHIHGRVRALVQQRFTKTLTSLKASKGSTPGYVAILLCRQGRPATTRAQAIPFDKQNMVTGNFIPPDKEHKGFRAKIRIDRIRGDTGSDLQGLSKNGGSTVDTLTLKTHTRRTQSQTAHLRKMLSGEYHYNGCCVRYDDKNNKWMLHVFFKRDPERHAECDQRIALTVFPGRHDPFRGRCLGKTHYIGGYGNHVVGLRRKMRQERMAKQVVAEKRLRLRNQRRERQDNYKWAPTSSSKGHGRKRALQGWEGSFTRRWNGFKKHYNQSCCNAVKRLMLRLKVGKLRLLQPIEGKQTSRFLSKANVTEDDRERKRAQASWDYHQFVRMCREMCQAEGFEFELVQCRLKTGNLRKSA